MSDVSSAVFGYIGLGMMGSAMAEHLITSGSTGPAVRVFDLDSGAVDKAVGQGAEAAPSPAEIAAVADVISICVPAANHIEAVLHDAAGIGAGVADRPADAGPLSLVIHSTVHPDTILAARDAAAPWGVAVFDACVAGGPDAALTGSQTVLAGGLAEMDDRVRGLLDTYAAKIIDAGPVGAGAALKIAVNVMTYAQFAAAATSHDLMVGAGGNPKSLLEAWREIGQLGQLTEQFSALLGIPAEHVTGDFRTMLETQVGISQKDLSLALALGDTRPGTAQVVQAIHDAMPDIYGVSS